MHFTLSFENSSVPKNNENECKRGEMYKELVEAVWHPKRVERGLVDLDE
jgi:hypothetical protein